MFRIYLEKKIQSGSGDHTSTKSDQIRPSRTRNRRLFERYNVDHYHLTVLNDQDILVVRDLSAKGFSSDVSERAFMRFEIGDVYSGKLRFLGEVYSMKAKVSWKQSKVVGFEVVDADTDFLKFLGRVIKPIKIGSSLRELTTENNEESKQRKICFKGDFNTLLYVWQNSEDTIEAWQLIVGEDVVEWSTSEGFVSGVQRSSELQHAVDFNGPEQLVFVRDKNVNDKRKRFAIDVIAALPTEHREGLLSTLER